MFCSEVVPSRNGQKQKNSIGALHVRFAPKAEIERRDGYVRLVPKGDIRGAANSSLFDHLVCAQHEPGRNLVTDRLRGPEIDDQLEVGRLLDRHISGSGAP
jgi:hypothetical protein